MEDFAVHDLVHVRTSNGWKAVMRLKHTEEETQREGDKERGSLAYRQTYRQTDEEEGGQLARRAPVIRKETVKP